MYPLTRSTSRSRFFGLQQFTPAVLFAAGEQGAWYDPSDYSTLFQDVAGTTPVTGVEQFVRLMRDKSGRGNDATAPSDPARPILRARYNLLTYTEDFSNAAWVVKTNLSITSGALDPDGGTTAITLTATSANGRLVQAASAAAGVNHTASIWARRRTGTGTVTWEAANVGVGATITLTSSWQRFTLADTNASAFFYYGLRIDNSGDAIDVWHPDLRVTNDALNQPAYQRVAAATDYDTAGFLPYLEFNGSTWSMSTAAIDFSGTDKMTVFAGVRKYTATDGVMVELSVNASSGSYPGSFFISNPTTARWYFLLRGAASIVTYEPQTYTAPITSLLTSSMDLSQSTIAQQLLPRVNGVLEQENSGGSNAGTGNFGNYPLFIGARNSTLFPFNGRLYSAIIRGAASSASEIAATEAWVNARTQAY